MHKSSMEAMAMFLSRLNKDAPLKILDVGSQLATKQTESYRDLIKPGEWEYFGLDTKAGRNVDIVSEKPFEYPVENNSFDVIISGQCVEHVSKPWLWIKELYRILRPSGWICIIAPSAGPIHRKPPATYDYWRILPDGMRVLLEYAGFVEIETQRHENEPWRDCVGIARKT